MTTLASPGDVAFFAGGFAACWFFKDKIIAAVARVKAKV